MSRAQFRKLMQEDPVGAVETLIFFQEKLRLAEEALEFYADRVYNCVDHGFPRCKEHIPVYATDNCGDRARAVLKKIRGEK